MASLHGNRCFGAEGSDAVRKSHAAVVADSQGAGGKADALDDAASGCGWNVRPARCKSAGFAERNQVFGHHRGACWRKSAADQHADLGRGRCGQVEVQKNEIEFEERKRRARLVLFVALLVTKLKSLFAACTRFLSAACCIRPFWYLWLDVSR